MMASRAATTTDLLTEATVRIDIGGEPNGSGFFISPGYVVTCAHVIDPYLETSAIARPTLGIVDTFGRTHRLAGTPQVDAATDLALLQLAEADTRVATVLLDDGFEAMDSLQSFGYPETKPDGESVTFEVEGRTGGPVSSIKFKEGQVRPGTSGAPLLNLRTGAVCGIVVRTRNEQTSLGGYGIRITTLLSVFERVSKINDEANVADSRWLNSLDAEQRPRFRLALTSPADSTEFVLRVGPDGDEWRVDVVEVPGDTVAAVPVDLNSVRNEVPRLFRAWKLQRRIDEGEQSRLLGRVLYRSVMPAEIAKEFERLAFAERSQVNVSLHFDASMDADLIHLPWEHLYLENGSRNLSVGTAPQATFARVCDPRPISDPPAAPSSASVLLLSAPARSLNDESTRAAEAIVGVVTAVGATSLARPDSTLTLDELEDFIAAGANVDVVHYIGYGRYFSAHDEIAMRGDSPAEAEFVDPEQLGQAMFPRPPRLVVLQTFLDDVLVPVDPTAFAMPLLNQGVEAVVAFPYPLSGNIASKAAAGLYERLASGMPIRTAVQELRRSERASPWSRPALFMRRPSDIALVSAG
jgi:hypothetical protein